MVGWRSRGGDGSAVSAAPGVSRESRTRNGLRVTAQRHALIGCLSSVLLTATVRYISLPNEPVPLAITATSLALAPLHWRIGGETHHQHRAGSKPDNAFRDTPQQHMTQSCPPVSSHDNQVDMGRAGRLNDDLERHAVHDGVVTRESGCSDTFAIGFHGLGNLVFQVLEKGVGHGLHTTDDERLNDMQQGQPCLKFAGQRHGILQGVIGIGTEIGGNENMLRRHKSYPLPMIHMVVRVLRSCLFSYATSMPQEMLGGRDGKSVPGEGATIWGYGQVARSQAVHPRPLRMTTCHAHLVLPQPYIWEICPELRRVEGKGLTSFDVLEVQ